MGKGGEGKGRLAIDEIVNKLNRVPVFCIADDKGNLFCATDTSEGKEPFVLWHTDAEMARKMLSQAQKALPNASLQCLPLGVITAVIKGWAETEMSGGAKFRVAATDIALATFAKINGLTPADLDQKWVLPVFFSQELVRTDGMPIFLAPQHLELAWQDMVKATVAQGQEPPELKIATANLLELVEAMRTDDDSEWSAFLFVGARSSIALAMECNPRKKEGGGGEGGPPSTAAGEPEEKEKEGGGGLLERKKEIVGLLNSIPTFTMVNGKGEVFMRVDPQSRQQYIPWILDGAHALRSLEALHAQGKVSARLCTQSFGEIFAILADWKHSGTPAEMRLFSYAEGEALYARAVAGTPKAEEMAARSWRVPVFYCRAMFTEAKKFVFFNHNDLIAAHRKKLLADRAAKAAAEDDGAAAEEGESKLQLAIIELMELVGMIVRGSEEWSNVVFVGPSSAKQALEAIRSAPPPDPDDEPPQLNDGTDDGTDDGAADGAADGASGGASGGANGGASGAVGAASPREPPLRSFAPPPSRKDQSGSFLPRGALLAVAVACVIAVVIGLYLATGGTPPEGIGEGSAATAAGPMDAPPLNPEASAAESAAGAAAEPSTTPS